MLKVCFALDHSRILELISFHFSFLDGGDTDGKLIKPSAVFVESFFLHDFVLACLCMNSRIRR